MIPWWIVSLDSLEHPFTLQYEPDAEACWTSCFWHGHPPAHEYAFSYFHVLCMLLLPRLYSASLSWFSHWKLDWPEAHTCDSPIVTHLTARGLVAACFPIAQQRSRGVVEPRQNVKLKCTVLSSSNHEGKYTELHDMSTLPGSGTPDQLPKQCLNSTWVLTISWPSHDSPHTQKLWRPRLAGALDAD